VPDGHFKQATRNGGRNKSDMARVGWNGPQTASVWAGVILAQVYPGAGILKQSSGIAEVMPSADLGQHRQSRLAVGLSSPMDVGTDPGLCAKLEPLDRVMGMSPQTTTSGLPPGAAAERWKAGFTLNLSRCCS